MALKCMPEGLLLWLRDEPANVKGTIPLQNLVMFLLACFAGRHLGASHDYKRAMYFQAFCR